MGNPIVASDSDCVATLQPSRMEGYLRDHILGILTFGIICNSVLLWAPKLELILHGSAHLFARRTHDDGVICFGIRISVQGQVGPPGYANMAR